MVWGGWARSGWLFRISPENKIPKRRGDAEAVLGIFEVVEEMFFPLFFRPEPTGFFLVMDRIVDEFIIEIAGHKTGKGKKTKNS